MLKRIPLLAFLLVHASLAAAKEPCPLGVPQLIVYHAGSLSAAFNAIEEAYTQQTGVCVTDVAGGSVSLARQITAGRQLADLYAGADFEVIDQMLQPAGFADYSIRFAAGAMVLAYTTESKQAATIAGPGKFEPPDNVPEAAADWATQLTRPGVTLSGSHPFLDPGAYRADMIFQLAQAHYALPNLYDQMLSHYRIAGVPGGLGKAFDYQFTYEHGARAAAAYDKSGNYRYVQLPDEVNLGNPAMSAHYAKFSVPMPGLQTAGSAATVSIPATRVTWGITLMKSAPNPEHAIAFLQFLLGNRGTAMLNAHGPAALSPAIVSNQDYPKLPALLKPLVQAN
jgi:molybdate/tungstate transport system substrate-binding protein